MTLTVYSKLTAVMEVLPFTHLGCLCHPLSQADVLMGEGILDYSTEIIVVQLLLEVTSQRIILHESGLMWFLSSSRSPLKTRSRHAKESPWWVIFHGLLPPSMILLTLESKIISLFKNLQLTVSLEMSASISFTESFPSMSLNSQDLN